ncbi:MAG: conjugative transposon protein TraM [Sphingobacteriaceae bacterium]|nr:MAG: conjugative transposon protein TraM [Sphingobacteriaceae bacterium]
MKINFKKPKYVIPLLIYPFLTLFFYVYRSAAKPKNALQIKKSGMQENVADVSSDVKKTPLSNKLDAFTKKYKDADGYSAIGTIDEEQATTERFSSGYSNAEKHTLDSIEAAAKERFSKNTTSRSQSVYMPNTVPIPNRLSAQDRALASALSKLGKTSAEARVASTGNRNVSYPAPVADPKEPDPMETFKKQMSYMDSIQRSSDPELRAEAERQKAVTAAELERGKYKSLSVTKNDEDNGTFNSIYAKKGSGFIKAIIDENIVGYSGSRIRIRLLDDIKAGNHTIPKGSYLYALISGFTEQRAKLTVTTILQGDKIFPVQLDIYDLDGLEGLYIPSSAFRDFTRNLGSNGMQGINSQSIGGSSIQNQQQFLMSSIDKVFTSTSQAIANIIRKNKAKVKYNTNIYLIDKKELQVAQQQY